MSKEVVFSSARSSAASSPKSVVVLQARMASSRLPGKVLAPIAGRSILAHCVERLRAARVGEVIVATTTRGEDEGVVAEAERLNVRVVRGAVDDVLGRFEQAIADWRGPYVFRATADNPLVDVDGPRRLLEILEAGADYCLEEGLPVGTAVEGVRTAALREAARTATVAYDREHVTPFLRHQRARFDVRQAPAPPALYRPHLRLTVDTRADLEFVRSLAEQAGAAERVVPLRDVIALADRSAAWVGVA
jgi:spore coat polysaccharide biosynthesis protein SpsF